MPHRRTHLSWDALAPFVQAHPAPGRTQEDAQRLATRLIRGPEAVLALDDERGAVVVAAVIDTCASADASADLALLALREPTLSSEVFQALFDQAEACVRDGPLSALELTLAPELATWEPALRARGYAPAYATHVLERAAEPAPTPPRQPLPEGWRWHEVDDAWLPDYHRVVTAAFAPVPGAFVPPLEEMAQAVKGARWRPQVLVEDGRVRAFVTVRVHERGAARVGEVRSLGRDPDLRGQGLGEHLLARALELLRAQGVERLELEVAAENDAALRLYLRQGFQSVRRLPVFRRRLDIRRT
jgi:ribosomal protein S18 acetylase RimI-like enzyme